MRTHEGHEYYFNVSTKQTSWIRPAHMSTTNTSTNTTIASTPKIVGTGVRRDQ